MIRITIMITITIIAHTSSPLSSSERMASHSDTVMHLSLRQQPDAQ